MRTSEEVQIAPLWMRKSYRNLTVLNCSRQQLKVLPVLPPNLISLDCAYNQLTSLDKLPNSLIYLKARANYIRDTTTLPLSLTVLDLQMNCLTRIDYLPPRLVELNLMDNDITFISELPKTLLCFRCDFNPLNKLPQLPVRLNHLSCVDCSLTSLPSLPDRIKWLDVSSNNLTVLPRLPKHLLELRCSFNYLTTLPELPVSLRKLSCTGNGYLNVPISIIRCINLRTILIAEHDRLLLPVRRFIEGIFEAQARRDRIGNIHQGDTVHNQEIEMSVRQSIENVIKTSTQEEVDSFDEDEIRHDTILSQRCKQLILHWMQIFTIPHSVFYINYRELFIAVWNRIVKHENSTDIKKVLNQEIYNSEHSCSTGKYSRLVSCLDGFYPDVVLKISDVDQIGNIITTIREKMGERYNEVEHKRLARNELRQRGFSYNLIEEWISYI